MCVCVCARARTCLSLCVWHHEFLEWRQWFRFWGILSQYLTSTSVTYTVSRCLRKELQGQKLASTYLPGQLIREYIRYGEMGIPPRDEIIRWNVGLNWLEILYLRLQYDPVVLNKLLCYSIGMMQFFNCIIRISTQTETHLHLQVYPYNYKHTHRHASCNYLSTCH